MSPTRRDTFKMTAGAALAALGLKPLTTDASPAAESFDPNKHQTAFNLMMVAAGVNPSRDMDLADAMWNHFYGYAPLPAEYDYVREQCRNAFAGALDRLDDPNPSAV